MSIRPPSTPLDDLGLSVRARNAFANAGIETLGDLVTWAGRDLLTIKNFGLKSLREVELVVAACGYALAPGLYRLVPDKPRSQPGPVRKVDRWGYSRTVHQR